MDCAASPRRRAPIEATIVLPGENPDVSMANDPTATAELQRHHDKPLPGICGGLSGTGCPILIPLRVITHMALLHNIRMALTGRTKHWNETNNAAITQLFDYFGDHFYEEEALREMFRHFLAASALSTSHLIYEGNPRKSAIHVDIKSLNRKSMIDAHIMGIQLYATMFSDINRNMNSTERFHLIFRKVFPEFGVIDSIACCAGRENFDLVPYASTYFNELAARVGASRPSSLDWLAATAIITAACEGAVKGIKKRLG